jgi:hypothetical protein
MIEMRKENSHPNLFSHKRRLCTEFAGEAVWIGLLA